ncbi:MAG: N-acetyltransferase [Halobacillus sp.]|uniref:GNAT family N-acetyltransferase n=1 Tax=Halobacillus sp. TaxID=56800 RepID=UPI003BAF0BD0
MEFIIRQELTEESNNTEEVIQEAFKNEDHSDKSEHLLVRRIRESKEFIPQLSLVAVNQSQGLIGHILLSKIKIISSDRSVESLALAPVSVLPEFQNKGVGSQLIHRVLAKAKDLGYTSIIVLGHKDYYPKFGFEPAAHFGIKAPFEVPNEFFMAIELEEGGLDSISGVVHYPEAFSE